MKKIKIEYSSCALKEGDTAAIIEKALNACEEHNFDFGVQIHNTADIEQIEKLSAMKIPLSFHAPVMTDYSINLAAEDFSVSLEAFDQTAELMRKFNVKKAVFHGFFMTDIPIPAYGRGRSFEECAKVVYRPELVLENSTACRDFFDTEEYKTRLKRVKKRLAVIKEKYSDIKFLMENDSPCYVSGMMLPDFFQGIDFPVCFDTSHLWWTAFVYDRNFNEETRKLLDTGLVEMVHIHASPFTKDIPKEKWWDGHKNFSTPNEMELDKLARSCAQKGISNFIFEFNDVTEKDIHIFANMLRRH
jgi:sugar phosphate isomerase/epimerase